MPIEFSEVTISRTLFRNGGSEYAINGEQCRLLDIQELLSDSGIGREMHVIVGQGQLDSILHATPEDRRGFIEEAAGVLKHRKRKEKALRKLDAMEANLTRLQDLTSELRRQLKPLGQAGGSCASGSCHPNRCARCTPSHTGRRSAAVARPNSKPKSPTKPRCVPAKQQVEAAIAGSNRARKRTRSRTARQAPQLAAAQETWFALSAARERFHGLDQLARATVRHLQPEEEDTQVPGVIPSNSMPKHDRCAPRSSNSAERSRHCATHSPPPKPIGIALRRASETEQRRIEALEAAAADRREGLATLEGQVNSAASRRDARSAEISRLEGQIAEARARADSAQSEFASVEVDIVGLDRRRGRPR